jgi:RIO kinase 1
LKRSFEDDPEEELITFEKIKPGMGKRARTRSHAKTKPTRKTSYESSADVQRWLREQSYDVQRPDTGFHPTLLASKRDAPWILSSLEPFYKQHLITDVLHEAHSGVAVCLLVLLSSSTILPW